MPPKTPRKYNIQKQTNKQKKRLASFKEHLLNTYHLTNPGLDAAMSQLKGPVPSLAAQSAEDTWRTKSHQQRCNVLNEPNKPD